MIALGCCNLRRLLWTGDGVVESSSRSCWVKIWMLGAVAVGSGEGGELGSLV